MALFLYLFLKSYQSNIYQSNNLIKEISMETYLFITLIFVYILTAFMLPKNILKRIWTIAYILSFIITSISIFYIKLYATDTLMKVGELNWYYILYVFGSISIILGLIMLWLYKKPLINLFITPKDNNLP